MSSFFTAMEITASGLDAQRTRMNALASNLANARTTRTSAGGPYRRLDPVFEAVPMPDRFGELVGAAGRAGVASAPSAVRVREVRQDQDPPQLVYDPSHPDADAQGYVQLPNVNVVEEMVNMITASRAYEAGVTAMQSLKGMARSALSIAG
jgi:flagellar basal-body rod protein FlgC